jgi:primosomal protein N' (replication factor Y)
MYGLVEVAPIPAVPMRDLFTYRVPDDFRGRLVPGMRVRVPFGTRTRTGVVAGFADTPPPGTLRTVLAVIDEDPFLPPDLLELCRWTARYYLVSLAEVIATVVPSRTPAAPTHLVFSLLRRLDEADEAILARRAPARARAYRALDAAGGRLDATEVRDAGLSRAALRGLIEAGLVGSAAQRRTAPVPPPLPGGARHALTAAQRLAVDEIAGSIERQAPTPFVLHGVTGSGKTEIYLSAAERVLAADRDVLLLVPEIALTHQVVSRTRERFGDLVAVLHSGLGPAERWAEWDRIRRREARVVIGARSAVFAPVARVGLIVVDEEHDGAYKQEDGIRYHARDLAVVRARLAGASVVLGSATPSIESMHAARDGRHRLLELEERPGARPLPIVDIVDLRGRVGRADGADLLTSELREALGDTLARGEQALIFLNRRGYARYLQCPTCGTPVSCPHCSVTLTWHRQANALVCHHCHFHRPATVACDQCDGPPLLAFGLGTEQLEALVRRAHPSARVARLDRDTAARGGAQRRILEGWHAGTIDVLVGTQMISKGHDVPGVTLVAVILADLSLNMPDFRAAERTLQLLVQVAGRAGRGHEPGRVLVQTFRPGHPSVQSALRHDYGGFVQGELERRAALDYPPHSRLVMVRLEGRDDGRTERAADELARALRDAASGLGLPAMSVLGPAPPPIERVRGWYRWQIMLRAAEPRAVRALARGARAWEPHARRRHLRLAIDVDSYSM